MTRAKLLERMYQKAGSAIVLIDIHDAQKKDDFIRCRKEIVADYEERYRNLPKFFYEKAFLGFCPQKRSRDRILRQRYERLPEQRICFSSCHVQKINGIGSASDKAIGGSSFCLDAKKAEHSGWECSVLV
ncbi:MAG: hypothetical protein IK130_11585 [Oscillospiraceae bacterium]|nr:hypothetical protein [Oscillospiraceae bacterium]